MQINTEELTNAKNDYSGSGKLEKNYIVGGMIGYSTSTDNSGITGITEFATCTVKAEKIYGSEGGGL